MARCHLRAPNWNRKSGIGSVPRRALCGYFFRAGRCEPPVGRARSPRDAIPGSHGQREPPDRAAPISIHLNTSGNLPIARFGFRRFRIARALDDARAGRTLRSRRADLDLAIGGRESARGRDGSGSGRGGTFEGGAREPPAALGSRPTDTRQPQLAGGGPAGVQPVSARAVSHTHPSVVAQKKKLHGPAWRGTTNLWGGAPARAYRRP